MARYAIVVLFALFSSHGYSFENDIVQECYGRTKQRPWAYCLTKPVTKTNPDIIYFVHGANDSEKTWYEKYGDVREVWRSKNKPMPTVISFSFAPVWLTVAKNGYKTSGLLDWIPKVMMPLLEAQVGGLAQSGKRMVLAKSMGGYNATQLAFHYPGMFSRVAMISPAIVQHSPFDLDGLKEFIKRTGANKTKAFWTSMLFRSFFPADELWLKSAPFHASEIYLNAKTPELYISAGDKDDYGFYEGSKHFAAQAKEYGVSKVVWDGIAGGKHHQYRAEAIADFLNP